MPKISYKAYRCLECGHEESHQTNHYGKIYNIKCKGCGWKKPMQLGQTFECIEDVPEGGWIPPEWKSVTLGEILGKKGER